MSLELRRQEDGRLRDHWYARYEVNGRRFTVNLGVKVSGMPPASGSLREEGDTDFERGRATAQAKLDALVEEARSGRNATHLIERLYESKTGESVKSVKLEALVAEWEQIPRARPLNATYASQCRSTLERFVAFLREQYPKVSEVGQVSRSMALAFLEVESKRGITGKTWNDKLKVLRRMFRAALPSGHLNPLMDVSSRESETVFRHPFTPEELKVILEVARLDDFIRPILVVGMCTAMRRGDCCLLSWKDVDLENRFLTVKTSKTGETVSIPIFPMLEEELKGLAKKAGAKRAGYVFPSQAKMYLENPDGITIRVKKVLAVALSGKAVGKLSKKKRLKKDRSKGVLWEERNGGMRRASVRDFHSFRVTWVTLALTAGVPLELVQRVTGHQTTDIVLKHYFRPGREAFRSALSVAMPQLMMGAPVVVVPAALAIPALDPLVKRLVTARGIVEGLTAKTWSADRARLLELLTPPAPAPTPA